MRTYSYTKEREAERKKEEASLFSSRNLVCSRNEERETEIEKWRERKEERERKREVHT